MVSAAPVDKRARSARSWTLRMPIPTVQLSGSTVDRACAARPRRRWGRKARRWRWGYEARLSPRTRRRRRVPALRPCRRCGIPPGAWSAVEPRPTLVSSPTCWLCAHDATTGERAGVGGGAPVRFAFTPPAGLRLFSRFRGSCLGVRVAVGASGQGSAPESAGGSESKTGPLSRPTVEVRYARPCRCL